MKKSASVLALILIGLSIGSCNATFTDFFNSIQKIEIIDKRNAYHLGLSFDETNELEILATYSDNKTRTLSYSDVSKSLSMGKRSFSTSETFKDAGDYSLSVSKGAVQSNTISLSVYESAHYVSGFTVNVSKTNIKTMEEIDITLDISPSNYSVAFEVSSSSDNSVIKKINKNTYRYYEEKPGDATLTFKALSNSTEYISRNVVFSISEAVSPTEIQQTYKTLSTSNCPSIGDVKLLVIPVWFTDSSSYVNASKRELIRSDINDAYFANREKFGSYYSVSEFYKEESAGKLNLTGTVSEWYESDKSISYAGTYETNISNTQAIVKSAVDWYFTNHTEDSRANYDSDKDGYLDGVITIYAAPDCRAVNIPSDYMNKYQNLWAYCSWVSGISPSVANPTVRPFFWASYDFMYGLTSAVDRTGSNYYKGTTAYSRLDTHTYIHEMGHVLGLEDYYDYSNQYIPAGGFSMEDFNVGGHDPYSLMAYGWVDPYIPTDSCRIKIGTFQKTKEVILLTPSWNSYSSVFDEYLLLELYSPEGTNTFDINNIYSPGNSGAYPSGTTSVGIRLWHVDARLTKLVSPPNTFSSELYSDARPNNHYGAFTNTFPKDSYSSSKEKAEIESHLSKIYSNDKKNAMFNLLSLIRNDKNATYLNKSYFGDGTLFKTGDAFSMNEYGRQFPYKDLFSTENYLLDSGKSLGWSFQVESIENGSAIIRLIKE